MQSQPASDSQPSPLHCRTCQKPLVLIIEDQYGPQGRVRSYDLAHNLDTGEQIFHDHAPTVTREALHLHAARHAASEDTKARRARKPDTKRFHEAQAASWRKLAQLNQPHCAKCPHPVNVVAMATPTGTTQAQITSHEGNPEADHEVELVEGAILNEEDAWAILHWPFSNNEARLDFVRLKDTDPEGPWDDDCRPSDVAHWWTEGEALEWARKNLPRLHPRSFYFAFNYGRCRHWNS